MRAGQVCRRLPCPNALRHHAGLVVARGAAVIVMTFAEAEQADTVARKTEICARACRILMG